MSTQNQAVSPLVKLRSRDWRGTHSRVALQAIFKAAPVAHCAFIHNGKGLEGPDGEEKPTVMNMPLLAVLRPYEKPKIPKQNDDESEEDDDNDPEEGELVAYLHTYYGSRLVQAIKSGVESVTLTTTKMDGLVLNTEPQSHSVNYRSATIYGHQACVLSNTPKGSAEKLWALDAVVDDVTGYERTKYDPPLKDVELRKTAIVRIRIEDASCKQRTGGPNGGEPPLTVQQEPEGVWTGVVPCWTQYGKPVGHGNHADVVENAMKKLSEQGERYALDVTMAKTKVEGS